MSIPEAAKARNADETIRASSDRFLGHRKDHMAVPWTWAGRCAIPLGNADRFQDASEGAADSGGLPTGASA
jgi:hypothetical protein